MGIVPLVVVTILWLVFLEGLLSADNALVLAMMVKHLPRGEQRRALRYGIWGAFAFRIAAVSLVNLLLDFWFLKVIGGAYLLYLAAAHFLAWGDEQKEAGARRFGRSFWGTVLAVELADIAFSIDSILAAVALADDLPETQIGQSGKFWIVVTGGILGIIAMRFVAGQFILLLDRYRGLESGAYALVAWIGAKLVCGGFFDTRLLPFKMNEWVFWGGMLTIVVASFFYQPKPKMHLDLEDDSAIEEVARVVSGDDAEPR
jgi:YkoY family integral membrane protein